MKFCKLLLAVAGATVLLGSLTAAASAGRLSNSANSLRATWARMDFTGGFGTVECEVTLEGTLHSRTITKTAGSLIGYITAAAVSSPCRRGGATILSETLPWHVTYNGFSGTLPNITAIRSNVIGAAFRIREPTFGVTCLSRTSAAAPGIGTYSLAGGTITGVSVEGTIPCGSFSGRLSGNSTSVTTLNSTTRITVTLI